MEDLLELSIGRFGILGHVSTDNIEDKAAFSNKSTSIQSKFGIIVAVCTRV